MQAAACVPGSCTGAQAAFAGSGPVSVSFPVAPGSGVKANDLVAIAGGLVFCVPCDDGEPPPGSCEGVVCDDGDPCTADSCSYGACFFAPIGGACCDGSIATALADMQEGLLAFVEAEGLGANLQIGMPVPSATGGDSALLVFGDTATVRSGSSSVACGTGADSVSMTFDVTDGDPLVGGVTQGWTLVMNLWQEGDTLHLDGVMTHVVALGATTVYTGGWTYSDATGPLPDPASEAGFQEAVGNMFNLDTSGGAVAGHSSFFGTIISFIGNVGQLLINYILDIPRPYTPPVTCLGPSIPDGTGQSCENDRISCSDQLVDLCQMIGDIPNVSIGFRKCMKGRCGCSGSSFSRTRITCESGSDCGFCGNAGGCSLGGTRNWYCEGASLDPCSCANTVFQEMAHSCGALHTAQYYTNGFQCVSGDASCAISGWFRDQCSGAKP